MVTLSIRFKSQKFTNNVKRSILRDVITATCLGITVLGPLLDASLAAALHEPDAGIYPLTGANRDALIEMMVVLARR